jgi:hypothetical protein
MQVTSSVVGGAMLPHAPQFFTMPETEDRATVARVKAAAAEIGARLKLSTLNCGSSSRTTTSSSSCTR